MSVKEKEVALDILLTALSYDLYIISLPSLRKRLEKVHEHLKGDVRKVCGDLISMAYECWDEFTKFVVSLLNETGYVRAFARDIYGEFFLITLPCEMPKECVKAFLDFVNYLEENDGDAKTCQDYIHNLLEGFDCYMELHGKPAEYITYIIYKIREKYGLIEKEWSEEVDGVKVITGKSPPVEEGKRVKEILLRNVYRSKYAGHTMFEVSLVCEKIKERINLLVMKEVSEEYPSPGVEVSELVKILSLLYRTKPLTRLLVDRLVPYNFFWHPQVRILLRKEFIEDHDLDIWVKKAEEHELPVEYLEDFPRLASYLLLRTSKLESFIGVDASLYDVAPHIPEEVVDRCIIKLFRVLGLDVLPCSSEEGIMVICFPVEEPYLSLVRYEYAYPGEVADIPYLEMFVAEKSFQKRYPLFVGAPLMLLASYIFFGSSLKVFRHG